MEDVTEQMNNLEARTELTPIDQVAPDEVNQVMRHMERAYAERWQGEDNFRDNIWAYGTQLLRIYSGDDLAAALVLDNDRISIIAVSPDHREQGFGKKLFEEAAKARPNVWITVAVDAYEMMATLTSKDLPFFPVESKDELESLFKATNQGKDKYQIETETKEIPLLSERLREKGVDHDDTFLAFTRQGGTHASTGKYYPQLIFQSKPQ